LRPHEEQLAHSFNFVAHPSRGCDLRCAVQYHECASPPQMQLSMGHDCTHDGGVTVPPCRTLGWVPKAREPGSGVQRKPVLERQERGSIPICTSRVAVTPSASSPIARLTPTGCCFGWSQGHVAWSCISLRMVAATRLASLVVTTASGVAPGARIPSSEATHVVILNIQIRQAVQCAVNLNQPVRRMRSAATACLSTQPPGVSAVAGSRQEHAIHGHFVAMLCRRFRPPLRHPRDCVQPPPCGAGLVASNKRRASPSR
jgi:hypothetical protein